MTKSTKRDPVSYLILRLMCGGSLAVAASSAALAQAAAPATDDKAVPPTVQEIVVTGLRASLKHAIDIKRASDVIVDSIASEDLGKFPDSNVAESLQRITGVSIDRSGGEGRFVTVRGFGPQFNTVLVNGRALASENPGREFSFDLLAADLIAGADVYKTTNAALQEGGIGSTINLRTARPFDIGDQKIILSAKANYEELSGQAAPDAFGLYSNTFMDGRLGVLASVSYQERKARIDQAATDGYYTTDVGQASLGNLIKGVNMPQDYYQVSDQEDRTRIGVTGTVQYKATNDLTLTLDGIYNKFTVKSDANEISHFFSPADISNVVLDPNRTVVSFDQDSTGHTDYVSRTFNRPTELKVLGFNANWNPTDLVNVKFDSAYSQATDENGGNEIFAVIGFNNPVSFSNTGSGLPSLTAANGFTNPDVGHAHFATYQGSNIEETVYENRLDGTFKTDYEHFTELRIGAIYTDRTKTNQLVQSSSNVWCTYCGYSIPVPNGLLQPFSPGGFLSGEGGNFPRQWLSYNPQAYFAFLQSQAAANAEDAATGKPIGTSYANLLAYNGYTPTPQPSSYVVHEKVTGTYMQADFKGIIGGLPWSTTVGARYVHTDLSSSGTEQPLLELDTNPVDPTLYLSTFTQTQTPITKHTNYDDFLPTVNVKVELTHDMIARLAVSNTITRPNLTDLAPQISYTQTRPGNLEATGGNPDLKPFKSTNFDLSYEWYYQKAGYFTVGAFYKQLKDFIVSSVGPEVFTLNPSSAFPTGQATFEVTRPRNIADADVYGLEIGFQHTFDYLPAPFDGLGVTANATFVNSSSNSGTDGTAPGLALPGLGDSQNVVGFYAKGPIEVRVAYNRRDGFLSTQANSVGGGPIYTKTAGQVDAQARYAITKNIAVVLEGINLNDAKTETYGAYQNQFLSLVETGPRYAIGFRAQF